MNNLSIKRKFTVLTAIVGAFMLALSCFGYITASNNLRASVNDEVVVNIQKAAEELDGWFGQRIALAIAQSNLTSSFGADFAKMKEKGSLSAAVHDKDVVDMGLGLEDGTFNSYVLGLTKLDPRTRSWYTNMKASGEPYMLTDVYVDQNTKQQVLSIVAPVKPGGQFAGAIIEDISLDMLQDLAKRITYHGQGTAMILDHTGKIIVAANPDLQGVENVKDVLDSQEHYNQVINTDSGTFTCDVKGEEMVFGFATLANTGWIIGFTVPSDYVFAPLRTLAVTYGIFTIVALLVILAICMKFSSAMSNPVMRLESHAKELAKGNLRIEDIPVTSQDEIGSLSKAFNEMSQSLRKLIRQMATTSEQVAASSEELTANAQQSADASVHVAETVGDVGASMDQQLRDIGGAKKHVDIVFRDIEQMAGKAHSVADTSNQTAEAASRGAALMEDAVAKMGSIEASVMASAEVVKKLGENSQQIGQIVEAISGIAEQTNLLSLNAAIEAARAGEQGRGFAVVAEEVRKLAAESQTSAEKIRDRISSIQNDTAQAVTAMESGTKDVQAGTAAIREVGAQFKDIMQMVDGIKSQMDGINTTVQTVSDGATRIVEAVDSIDNISRKTADNTQTISSATEEQSASNEEIAAASHSLAKLAEDMQVAIGQFKF